MIDAINDPEHVDQGYGGRKVAQKIINRKLLRVIYEEHEDRIIIITAYTTSKIEKYLR